MPSFGLPQLATLGDRPPVGHGWLHEIKFDGYRMQMRLAAGRSELRTRSGLDWSGKYVATLQAAKRLPDCIIDGEMVALSTDGLPSFPALVDALSQQETAGLVFFAFDLLFLEGEDLRRQPLVGRKALLDKVLQSHTRSGAIRYVEHFQAGAEDLLYSARSMKLEGFVSKRSHSVYASGKRGSWLKSKSRPGHEVVIGGWTHEQGRFRSLLVGVHQGDDLVYVGRVGTGYGAKQLNALVPRLRKVASDINSFNGPNAPKSVREIHWVRPELVAEIEFGGWTSDRMLRQASFKALRDDKLPAEVQAEMPARIDPRRSEKTRFRSRRTYVAPTPNSVTGITVSSPQKVLWQAYRTRPR